MSGGVRLEPGQVFAGDYRIVRPLAAGGMGAVYVADQLSTGKARALKVMRAELVDDLDARRRFEQEARVGARVASDHVVEIHAAGVDGETGLPFLVMELLVGEDLASAIERSGPMPPSAVLAIFEQLCHAIGAAHGAGVVHRDLKPENVFLAKPRRAREASVDVKVLDFGIAKVVEESASRKKSTQSIGTPLWMAPEQTELRSVVSPRTDVWALGLIAYYMLTGRPFWLAASSDEATMTQLFREVLMGPLPPPSARASEQGAPAPPAAFDAVFARAVCRDRDRRYADASQFVEALRGALGGQAVVAPGDAASGYEVTAPSDPRLRAAVSAAGGASAAAASPAFAPAATEPQPRPSSGGHAVPIVTDFWSDIGGVSLVRAVMIGGVLVFGPLGACLARRAMTPSSTRAIEPPAPISVVAPPPSGSVAVAGVCARRVCTVSVAAAGGLTQEQVTQSVERASFRFDDCMRAGRSRPRGGTVVVRFHVSAGAAVNRSVEAADTTGGLDQCVERQLASVAFPSVEAPTSVTYTLKLNPNGT